MTSIAENEARGTDIGKYRVIAELAKGGMGNVYLAVAQGPAGFNKLFAVKELKREFSSDEIYVAMFMEEARLAARLTHPNIVQTNEVGSDGNRHFMIMEYLDGRSLYRIGRHLTRYDGFPVGAHLRIIAEALMGLHYAHELRDFDGESLGIVHRDVSPLNVVVTFDGQTKVLDFGIAKSLDSSLETRTGVLKGRIAYMAPEQACGGKVDRRADIYSAGVMLWEAAAGRRLWPKMTDVEILSHVLRDGPPSLRAVCPSAPAELDAICSKAMARQLDDRYPTALALAEAIEMHLTTRDDGMSMREIGAMLSRAFEQERREMNAAIEESILRSREGHRSGSLISGPRRASGTHTLSGARAAADAIGSIPSLFPSSPSSDPSLRIERSDPAREPTAVRSSGASSGAEAFRGRSAVTWAIAAAAACALSAGVTYSVAHRMAPPAAMPNAAPAAAVAAPVRAAEVETVEVTIRVSPPTAQIAVDGLPVGAGSYHARMAKDARIHRVAVTADGYEPKLEDVSFGNDVAMDFSLDRRAAATRAAAPWTRPALAPAPQPTPAARPGRTASETPARGAPAGEEATAAPTPSPAAQPTKEVEPVSGRSPLRPIVTSNPYGAP